MKATPSDIDKFLKILTETPRRFAQAARGLDETRLQSRPDNSSWSANDILAHLRSCADVWGNSIEAMLAEENPVLPDIHPRKWLKGTNYPGLPFHESFQAYIQQREKLLFTLLKLCVEQWSRAGVIGNRKHTIFSQTRRMAKHEQEHVGQIEELLREDTQR